MALRTNNARPEPPVSNEAAGSIAAEAAFDTDFGADPARARAATALLTQQLTARGVMFGDKPLPTSIKPHFIRRSEHEVWTRLLAQLLEILETTANELAADPAWRREGPFSPEAWELLDIDPGYRRSAVVCRPDVIWQGNRIGIIEMNADSPAMMLYADIVQSLQRELFPMSQVERDHKLTFENRVPTMLNALLATYREWGGSKSNPTIAIVDWRGQKTGSEQEQLARSFTQLGCPSFVCFPDELEVRGGRLLGRGEPIDIVQRRVLFPDIVRRREELQAFLTAHREQLVCVVNPLRSYLVGCKLVLAELCRPERLASFDAARRKVVREVLPCTAPLAEVSSEVNICDRNEWVVKPAFGSGGVGVIIGRYTDDATWSETLRTINRSEWVIQSYLRVPLYRVPLTTGATHASTALYANWNPFFFGGVAGGAIARVSSDPVVGISARGALLPSVIVDDE